MLRPGLSPIQKATTAILQLACRTGEEVCDEYIRIEERTGSVSLIISLRPFLVNFPASIHAIQRQITLKGPFVCMLVVL